MSGLTPKIDRRTYNDIVNQTKTLVEQYSQWRNPGNGNVDAGLALIRIFARMGTLVRDRLNQVPDRNFLAFLNLIGAQLTPPQPAKVPLTFYLAEGSDNEGFVPAHTQVSALPLEGENEEVVFETNEDLVVIPAQIQAIFVYEPEQNCYSHITDKTKEFLAFQGNSYVEHYLYIACAEVFDLSPLESVTITLETNSPESATQLQQFLGIWQFWNNQEWQNLLSTNLNTDQNNVIVTLTVISDLAAVEINNRTEKWLRVNLQPQLNNNFLIVNQIYVNVQFAQTTYPQLIFYKTTALTIENFYPFGELPTINDTFYLALNDELVKPGVQIQFNPTLSKEPSYSPDLEITWEIGNGKEWQEIATTQETDKVHWLNNAVSFDFTAEHTSATLQFPSELPAPITVNGETHYWLRGRITQGRYGTPPRQKKTNTYYNEVTIIAQNAASAQDELIVDSIEELEVGDTIRLQSMEIQSNLSGNTLVEKIEEHKIIEKNAENRKLKLDSFLRYSYSDGTRVLGKVAVYETVPEIFAPPQVESLSLTYSFTLSKPACYLADNKFTYFNGEEFSTTLKKASFKDTKIIELEMVQNLSVGEYITFQDNQSEEHQIEQINLEYNQVVLTESLLYNHNIGVKIIRYFRPLTPGLEKNPTLYLGFDRPFPNRLINLYFQILPPKPEDVAPNTPTLINQSSPPHLLVEYASLTGWKTLGIQDDTQAFSQRGLIQFIGEPDFISLPKFGEEYYWLRIQKRMGEFPIPVQIKGILTNTTWATQAVTLYNEILGSSNGEPNQAFYTTQSPILFEQQLEIEEGELPTSEEAETRDVTMIKDETGNIEQIWVSWQEVSDFYSSNAKDRHYILDRLIGKIQFGDGQAGMIPPRGRNNIRLRCYQTGGGTWGNRAAETIVQLKTTIPYIDSVINLEPAAGGREQESLERVKERVPKQLRHRDRAVTARDFEDLAYEASTEVGRVKVITPDSLASNQALMSGGWVSVLIVPHSQESRPTPSLALINCVKDYLQARSSPTIDLRVAGPKWQQVRVITTIVPISLQGTDALRVTLSDRLQHFLHPLTGGSTEQGWSFGRQPHLSDLYALLESIPGVDRVDQLEIQPTNAVIDPLTLIYSGQHSVTLTVNSEPQTNQ